MEDTQKREAVNSVLLEETLLDSSETKSDSHTDLKELIKNAGTLKVFSGDCIKCSANGDLTLKYGNTHCILLRENFTTLVEKDGLVHKEKCSNAVGKKINFRVQKVEDNKVFASRKEYISELRHYYAKTFKPGDFLTGYVTAINEDLGIYVDIGADYTAIIPRKYAEHGFVKNLSERVQVGEKIEAVIKEIELKDNGKEFNKVVLSRVDALPDYIEIMKSCNIEIGDIISGTVEDIGESGVYVQINPRIVVLCKYYKDANHKYVILKPGDKVRLQIKSITTTKAKGKIKSKI